MWIYGNDSSNHIFSLSSYSIWLKFLHFFSKFIWVLVMSSWFNTCQTPIVVDIQTWSRHVYRVMWVHIVILQYLYCHDYYSNNFSDVTQFSVLQEAWVTCVCYSSWSSSQFHVEMLCCHHVHLYKYIYYYYAKELEVLQKMFHVECCSTYAYNWVHFWFLLFPEQLL